ncbi:VOC family protein [Brachyspira hyodysenteriae]|uniref:Glyoxylase family protein n=2 Tax=Brachyspira hyodysenteriae TaxID=159 RepID=A0A3B6V953_BRAHW|nr:VOC family protein [Brachyspira hyodysenteriae]ACN84002.1 glyoxylase family protein [Brachyspira hyodysenteriae WA1]ANN63890.1 glyoxalase [Brachyspira hyodysenteriae ATCC 27164]AUJ49730.1 glyoxalase/bleomycin resistance/dioxygenase family protein [Brachyspira hyodysenteriae]KLI16274.1 glyoxalase [Brachyspira hyodysenteriae]KLI22473.1 glyoxalase [Brachyspira hyodysenteriae]
MLKEVMHIGLTVSDMERSINFYRDVLGLTLIGEALMEGEETDALFAMNDCKVKIAYLNGSDNIIAPPIELLQFISPETIKDESKLNKISTSEICFRVDNIEKVYKHLIDNNVECLSSPQEFDFTSYGFSKSKALYFKDPDGIILELMQTF